MKNYNLYIKTYQKIKINMDTFAARYYAIIEDIKNNPDKIFTYSDYKYGSIMLWQYLNDIQFYVNS